LAAAALVSLALSLGIAVGQDPTQSSEAPGLGVDWDYRPADLADLVDNSPAIVVAQVDAVRDGDPIVIGPPDPDTGAAPTAPTQRVDVHVTSAIDGQTPQTFTLFKLGGPGEQPEGSPGYQVGERYLLFVRRRLTDDESAPNPDGTWLPVAPDGRLERLPSGRLDAELPGPVADQLDGDTVSQARQEITEAQSP
jgi:hypothetical protein